MRLLACTILAAAACYHVHPAVAAEGTWNGGATGVWDQSSTNWLNVTGSPWNLTNGGTNTAVLNTANAALSVTGAVYTGTISALQSGTLAGSGTITMAGAATPTISVATSTTLTINGVLAGSAGLTKTGAGTLILGGSNTIGSGTLTFGASSVNAGYIRLTNANALGGFTTVLLQSEQAAGVSGLELDGGITTTYDVRTFGRGSQDTTGYILRNLSGSNTWNGNVTIVGGGGGYGIVSSAGLLTIGGTISSAFDLSPYGPRTVTFAPGGGAITVSGRIIDTSGTNSAGSTKLALLKTGTGTLTLSGSNTYSQGTTFSSGTTTSAGILAVSHNAAVGTGTLAINSGAAQFQVAAGVSIANAITISNTATGGTLGTVGQGLLAATGSGTATLSGPITINGPTTAGNLFGSGSTSVLAITGAITSATTTVGVRTGTVIFSGGGSYAALELQEGVVRLGAANGIATGAEFRFSNANNNAATLDLAGYNQSLSGLVKTGVTTGVNTVGNSSTTSDSTLTTTGTSTFTGVIQDSVSGGTRKVALVVNGGSLTLTGSNSFSGGTTLSSGSLVLGNAAALGSAAGPLAVNGGTLDLAGYGSTVGGLSGAGGVITSGSAGSLTLTSTVATGTASFAGTIQNGSGTVGFTKSGAGVQVLSGANTYTGNTTLAAGTLQLSGGNNRLLSTGTLAYTGNNTTFDVTTTSQSLATMTTPNGGVFDLAATGAGGGLTLTGSLFEVGPGGAVDPGQRVSLDMTGLSNFAYTNAGGTLRVGMKAGSTNGANGTPGTSVLRLAQAATITAATLAVGDQLGSGDGGGANLLVGQSGTFNVGAINQGMGRADTAIQFATGLTNPTLVIRGTNGTAAAGTWTVGLVQTNPTFPKTSFTATTDLSGGTVDALLTAVVIGVADNGTATNRGGTQRSTFTMGSGTLAATTITVGQITGSATGSVSGAFTAAGTLNIGTPGGVVQATNLFLAENTILGTGSAASKTVSGTVNLSAGTLRATTIARGAQTGNAANVATAFNWTGGTIENIAGANLSITTLPITLASGTGTFNAVGTNSITVASTSPISGAGGLVKTGAGTLVLAAANTYTGQTRVSAGRLLINGNQSAATGTTIVESGAILGGSGVLGGAVEVLAGGIVAPGTSPETLALSGSSFTLAGTSYLVFELDGTNTTIGGGVNDLITGVGDLVLDGILEVTALAPFTSVANGTAWRLFNYTGTLTDNGLTIGPSMPELSAGQYYRIDAGTGVVNLVVVPEPGAVLMAAVGCLIGAAVVARRRRAARQQV